MKGIITALITPFNEDGTINEEGLREVVRYNLDVMKVNGLYVGGSTSESFLMDEESKRQLFKIVKDEIDVDTKLIAQIGALNIEEAVRLGKEAKELGYDALSAITPYYYKFSFQEIKAYYKRLTDDTDHPMIIYSNPAFTGAQFSVEDYGELLALPNVIGVKYTDTDLAKLGNLKESHPEKVFFSGADEMLLPFAISGADGAIGSTYNLLGEDARTIYEAVQKSDLETARRVQSHMNKVIDFLLEGGVYSSIKYVFKQKGIDAGYMKFPFRELTDEEKKNADNILEIIEK
ncbi:N-acetylneuraminate lyase [Natribacillus halophilus]|uniref:N-acetylneuraminate lyase n=1 Tax=Natribacillus halophilus TaxID=549003 RepID=A0A1G8QP11_9BACI|nr:N-acetylneuraminate lyase [Natribacillus halophilus]SDJ06484.1 N-acetylneuraminate lyase [Natribacillus halophilus]